MSKLISTSIIVIFISISSIVGQKNVHPRSDHYEWPDDPLVKTKLENWEDLKFGMIIHWGVYAVPGIVESWSICSEDWIERDSTIAYNDYKKWYWGLKEEFNPVEFDPDQWAKVAGDAGMRYVVFTTKHHDGFCMFDTRETDYKITNGPFADNPKADVTKYIFEAFRDQGFLIGAYFSKPDWHSEYYWWPKYATPDRNNNYDIRKYPWRWEKFKTYTFNQVSELMHNYGNIDILWLDGGWVRPLETVNDEVLSWGAPIPPWSQDINMPAIAEMAREAQPGILIVDRTVKGPYENYQTPERRVPENALPYPWESCLPLGNDWGFVPGDKFKSATEVIHTLIEIVAKGGNLLLGVGPSPEGILVPKQIERLQQIGDWLKINGDAIYNTRQADHFQDSITFFTRSKDSRICYAIYCITTGEKTPTTIKWKGNIPKPGTKVILLQNKKSVNWKKSGDYIVVNVPSSILKDKKNYHALSFSFTTE